MIRGRKRRRDPEDSPHHMPLPQRRKNAQDKYGMFRLKDGAVEDRLVQEEGERKDPGRIHQYLLLAASYTLLN